MTKYISTIAVTSMLLILGGCASSNQNQTVQQQQACTAGAPHPWCMQLAQTKPLGSWDANGPTNPEMQNDVMPYPPNRSLQLITPGFQPLMIMR
jgi:hypothetical protein